MSFEGSSWREGKEGPKDGEKSDERRMTDALFRLGFDRLSPDEIEAGHTFTHKRDIWHSGVTFLRMLWGADV